MENHLLSLIARQRINISGTFILCNMLSSTTMLSVLHTLSYLVLTKILSGKHCIPHGTFEVQRLRGTTPPSKWDSISLDPTVLQERRTILQLFLANILKTIFFIEVQFTYRNMFICFIFLFTFLSPPLAARCRADTPATQKAPSSPCQLEPVLPT